MSEELEECIEKFRHHCEFYVAAIDDALTCVIEEYVSHAEKKTDQLTLVQLRQMLEPYNCSDLLHALQQDFSQNPRLPRKLVIAIDGLDEHWDVSDPSLFFLAQLLSVTKRLTAKFDPHVQFLVCLRDKIFRALVDTKSVEYDKLESLVIDLQWNPRALFELIARRVAPGGKDDQAVTKLRELLPDEIDGISVCDYIGSTVLNRPREDCLNISEVGTVAPARTVLLWL